MTEEITNEISPASFSSTPSSAVFPAATADALGEFTIVIAGKSGAGKSTLINKVLDDEKEIEILISPKSTTTEIKSHKKEKNGANITIIDTPGLDRKVSRKREQLKKLSWYLDSNIHLLIYCIPVDPSSKFDDCNPSIIKHLQESFGNGIWKNCIIVFTFSNFARQCIKTDKDYKSYINDYASEFQKALKGDIQVKTIFEYRDFPSEPIGENTIVAIPAGKEPQDDVLPGINVPTASSEEEVEDTIHIKWSDYIFALMLKKCREECIPILLKYKYGMSELILNSSVSGVGAGLGACCGGIGGAALGPIGVPLGIFLGSLIGTILGAKLGAVTGASIPRAYDNIGKKKEQKKKKEEQS